MKLLKIITICLLLVAAFSCKNDDDHSNSNNNPNTNPEVFTENFGSEINRDFLGEVVDQNNNPIHNASITIGNQTTLTDANGVFIIRDANIYERFGYVKAEKSGYIHGSRSVVPTNGTNKVKIMLLEETIAGTTTSGTSETITLTNGASVALEGEYIKEDGSAYSGSVNVIMHHLDPTNEDMQNQMPGMLYAANAQNEERMLQTFGMLAVELRGSNGEDLNLATGSTAEITVPLDASLLATAPATIPLWYFDEVAGYWKEEGEATLIGSTYVGTVSHFSFWNCDVPFETIDLCINILNEGIPLPAGVWVYIESVQGTRVGYTNENGEVCGRVPSNESLVIRFSLSNHCESEIFESTIGPFTENSEINITTNFSLVDPIFETLYGAFNDCSGNPITNGYVSMYYGSYPYLEIISDGNFEFNLIRCSDDTTFSVEGIDFDNEQTTGIINYTFNTPNTNLGSITSCNSIEEFISYQVDDQPVITYNTMVSSYETTSFSLNILGWVDSDIVDVAEFNLGIQSQNTGTYNSTIDTISFYIRDDNLDISNPNSPTDITVNMTSFGNTGEYIDINFFGTFSDMDGDLHSISGTIHVIRDF